MVWTGNYQTHLIDLTCVFTCQVCSIPMRTPKIHTREVYDFGIKVNIHHLKPKMPVEQFEKAVEKHGVINQPYICGFGLINQCLNCGNKPYVLKGYTDSPDIIMPISQGFTTDYNRKEDKIKIRNLHEPRLPNYEVMDIYDESEYELRLRVHALFCLEMMPELYVGKTVDDILEQVKKLDKKYNEVKNEVSTSNT